MKKTIFTAIGSLLLVTTVFTQKNFLDISAGPAFPMGDFAKKDMMDSHAGFAKPGTAVKVSYTHLLGRRVGIIATVHGQTNPLNIPAIEKAWSGTAVSNGVIWAVSNPTQQPSSTGTIYPNWKFEKRSWQQATVMAGLHGQLPAGGLLLTGSAAVGLAWAAVPRLSGKSITDTATATFNQTGGNGTGIAWAVGGSLRYNANRFIYLFTNLEWLATGTITFKDIQAELFTTRGQPGSPGYTVAQSTIRGNTKQQVSSLNLYIGLGLRF